MLSVRGFYDIFGAISISAEGDASPVYADASTTVRHQLYYFFSHREVAASHCMMLILTVMSSEMAH